MLFPKKRRANRTSDAAFNRDMASKLNQIQKGAIAFPSGSSLAVAKTKAQTPPSEKQKNTGLRDLSTKTKKALYFNKMASDCVHGVMGSDTL